MDKGMSQRVLGKILADTLSDRRVDPAEVVLMAGIAA
jgi:hypothetical protein